MCVTAVEGGPTIVTSLLAALRSSPPRALRRFGVASSKAGNSKFDLIIFTPLEISACFERLFH